MPGYFWKRAVKIATLCSIFSVYLVATTPESPVKTLLKTPESPAKALPDNPANSQGVPAKEGFRFFKKEPSIVTSIIVRVYNQGKFVGFLLIDRGRPPLGPALPGGIVRYQENPEDCVKRTLFDECGISSISNMQQFKVFSDPARDPRMHAVDITYSVRMDDQKISSGTDAKQAWVCPLDKIPWDKLVFDHKIMLKTYLESQIASIDGIKNFEKIQLGSGAKNGVRNKNDFENVAKQAYRPPHLFVSGIIDVYEGDEFKGIAIADFKPSQNIVLNKNVKVLPGGGVAYGETIEQAFLRHMTRFQAKVSILDQFKAYSFFNEGGKKHDITVVFRAKADKKSLGTLQVYTLDSVPVEALGFHHKEIVGDYQTYRKSDKPALPKESVPIKAIGQ